MMNRRTATDADLTIDSIVYKGNGKVAYKVWHIQTPKDGATHPTLYFLQKPGSKSAPASRAYRAAALQVEAPAEPVAKEQTGIEMIRELCSF